ncbi:hypothetical protein [Bradyrhizobium cenepequi]|uniref:hypothetical protein n=1 Tax=Bradyrhizobium cenepequi TaxID=2821403 RepID=UPI001CE296F2|nr:hypothetical protein [Bradyrhizobium cenepequi]MCA6109424.1 hypothetical protein [Bradyrhizobium cenepequi]
MSSLSGAKSAVVGTAGGRHLRSTLALGAIIAVTAAGCQPATTRLANSDPADPAARVPGVSYRSTIAPYTSLRPATPAPWRERNEDVAPGQRQEPQQ